MPVLVVNAGSSSLKLRVLDDDDDVLSADDVEPGDIASLSDFCRRAEGVDLVGHRVVHGGPHFRDPAPVDDDLLRALAELTSLAPLQQPPALAGMKEVAGVLPGVPAFACFDTAFHATLPLEATTYPLPRQWRERYGLRRFGFHGLSHAYASRRAVAVADGVHHRVVTCHLGSGSSLAAVVNGVCVDTTMGFTPNEGIPMATRSGSVDVGMLTWLLQSGLPADELADGVQHRAGLAGLAGTGDMRTLVERAAAGDGDARLAIDVWLHRLVQAVAAMAASAGGVDLLVFTGGIGETAAGLRQEAAARLGWLGVEIDQGANAAATATDAVVSPSGSRVGVVVVQAREDVEIARGVRAAAGRT